MQISIKIRVKRNTNQERKIFCILRIGLKKNLNLEIIPKILNHNNLINRSVCRDLNKMCINRLLDLYLLEELDRNHTIHQCSSQEAKFIQD
jgi:hypothetical protein